ncbi:MAG TPA: energy transducer TonB [Vicinamibacterales bacterium]
MTPVRPFTSPAVFTAREIAAAAGVRTAEVSGLIDAGAIRVIGPQLAYVAEAEAVRAVRWLRRRRPGTLGIASAPATRARRFVPSLVCSTTLHAAMVAAIAVATSLGLGESEATPDRPHPSEPIRVVYLVKPGPGGGGGGGGKLQLAPPPRAERKAPKPKRISSPMPPRRPPPPPMVVAERPVERPAPPPPPPKAEPVVAPIASVPADEQDRRGVLEATTAKTESAGSGTNGGVGSGRGTGIGEGDGPGVGPGSGGGTGGGPYRSGSGVEPPQLLREVRPDYTEDARRRGVEGDVVLEIIVRRDGSVGDVRIVERLDSGLDQRAIAAVRQWRFAPARLRGAPVDVEVEVAVEFKLR